MEGYNIVVFGKKGFGKTTWLRRYIFENPDKLYIVYDHFDDFWKDDKGNKYLADAKLITNIDTLFLYLGSNPETSGVYIYQGEMDYDEFFGVCANLGNCICVFDEVDLACSPTTDLKKSMPNLRRIIHYGRHIKVGIMSASRRPANVHRDLTSQADELICFRIVETRDKKYIQEYTDDWLADQLPNLRIGEFVRYPNDDEYDMIVSQEVSNPNEIRDEDRIENSENEGV